jgi:hypothetical protein
LIFRKQWKGNILHRPRWNRPLRTNVVKKDGLEYDIKDGKIQSVRTSDGTVVDVPLSEEQQKEIVESESVKQYNNSGLLYKTAELGVDLGLQVLLTKQIGTGFGGSNLAYQTGVVGSTMGQMYGDLYETGIGLFDGDKKKAGLYASMVSFGVGLLANVSGVEANLAGGNIPLIGEGAISGLKNPVARFASRTISGGFGEAFEETVLEKMVDNFARMIMGKLPEKIDWDEAYETALLSFMVGAMGAGVSKGQTNEIDEIAINTLVHHKEKIRPYIESIVKKKKGIDPESTEPDPEAERLIGLVEKTADKLSAVEIPEGVDEQKVTTALFNHTRAQVDLEKAKASKIEPLIAKKEDELQKADAHLAEVLQLTVDNPFLKEGEKVKVPKMKKPPKPKKKFEAQTKEDHIAEWFRKGGRIGLDDFVKNNDLNNLKNERGIVAPTFWRTVLSKDKGTDRLDTLAQTMSDELGEEVTVDDITEFMLTNAPKKHIEKTTERRAFAEEYGMSEDEYVAYTEDRQEAIDKHLSGIEGTEQAMIAAGDILMNYANQEKNIDFGLIEKDMESMKLDKEVEKILTDAINQAKDKVLSNKVVEAEQQQEKTNQDLQDTKAVKNRPLKPIETKTEEKPVDVVEEPVIESIAKESDVQASDVKSLKDTNKKVFGLDDKQANAAAVVMDRVIGNIASRAKTTKKAIYDKLKFRKADKAPEGSLKQESPLIWKSTAKEGVGRINQKKATPAQWVKMINDRGGKGTSQELDWIGMEDFLNDYLKENGGKSVPKEVVEQYINDNQIEIVDVTKGGVFKNTAFKKNNPLDIIANTEFAEVVHFEENIWDDYNEDEWVNEDDYEESKASEKIENSWYDNKTGYYIVEDDYGLFHLFDDDGANVSNPDNVDFNDNTFDSFEETVSFAEKDAGRIGEGGEVKYENYTEPGNEGYREVLLTLPNKEGKNYNSGHWDEKNILAHLRISDRITADGKKVMFLEEVQSDWAQEGKKKGFNDGVELKPEDVEILEEKKAPIQPEGKKVSLEEYKEFWRKRGLQADSSDWIADEKSIQTVPTESSMNVYSVLNKKTGKRNTYRAKTSNEAIQKEIESHKLISHGVENMPYKKTDQWVGMAVRRGLKMAQSQGYDYVAWTTGEQQAKRYDLSDKVENIEVRNLTTGKKSIIIKPYSNQRLSFEINNEGNIDSASSSAKEFIGKNITEVIGKELGEKVLKTKNGIEEISGIDLEVGGEGMKSFYNKMLPKIVGKEAKRFDKKAKVEVVVLKSGNDYNVDVDKLPTDLGFKLDQYTDLSSKTDDKVADLVFAFNEKGYGLEFNQNKGVRDVYKIRNNGSEQLAIPITPEMRMNLNSAVPLFQGEQGAMAMEDSNYVIYALTDPNVSTPLHEIAHVYENYLTDKEKSEVLKWAGHTDWTTETSEAFARGFEKYLASGVAPSSGLKALFDQFKQWLTDIYNGIKGSEIDLELNDKMKEVYDEMVASENRESLQVAGVGVGKVPMKKFKEMVKRVFDNTFKSWGQLPKMLFELNVIRQARINAAMKRVSFDILDLEKAINRYLKEANKGLPRKQRLSELPHEDMVMLGTMLKDKGLIDAGGKFSNGRAIPEDILEVIGRMRKNIDAFSTALLNSNVTTDEMKLKISDALEMYVHRSYRVHTDPDWIKKVEELDQFRKAVAWAEDKAFKQVEKLETKIPQLELEAIEAERKLQRAIDNDRTEETINKHRKKTGMANWKVDNAKKRLEKNQAIANDPRAHIQKLLKEQVNNSLESIASGSTLGQKNLGIFKKRKNMPDELRALFGEYTDPMTTYAHSIFKMAHLYENHNMLEAFRDKGLGSLFFVHPEGEYNDPISSEGSPLISPMDGLHTTTEIKQAMQMMGKPAHAGPAMKLFLKGSVGVKYAKTILSPATQMRNFVQNVWYHWNNGHIFRMWNPKLGAEALDIAWASMEGWAKGSEESRAEYTRLMELGIIYESSTYGEIRSLMQDIANRPGVYNPDDRFVKRGLKKIGSKMEALYAFGDDSHKVFAYFLERARYAKALKKKKWKDLTQEEQTEIDEYVADIIRNTYQTYSMIPPYIKEARKLPITPSFVSFTYELYRNSANNIVLGMKEMRDGTRTGNARLAGIGASRIVGTATLYGAMKALASTMIAQLDMGDDDDFRWIARPWEEQALIIPIKREGQDVYSISTNSTIPQGKLYEIFETAFDSRKDAPERVRATFHELYNDFQGWDIFAESMIEAAMGRDLQSGREIFAKDDPERLRKTVDHLLDGFTPGAITSSVRLGKAIFNPVRDYDKLDPFTEILAIFPGVRVTATNIDRATYFPIKDLTERRISALNLYRTKAKADKYKNMNITERHEALADELENARAAYKAVYDEAVKFTKSMLNKDGMNVDQRVLRQMFSDAGFPKKEVNLIINEIEFIPLRTE